MLRTSNNLTIMCDVRLLCAVAGINARREATVGVSTQLPMAAKHTVLRRKPLLLRHKNKGWIGCLKLNLQH
jgi:hypothetical protein